MIQAWLAARSADVSYGLLLLLGLPVVRDGVFITVPGLTIGRLDAREMRTSGGD